MGHSPDCAGPYTHEQTSCYCGWSRMLYYERTVNILMNQLGVSWGPHHDDHDKNIGELILAAVQHCAWKQFAITLIAKATDTDVDLWVGEKNPPVEFLTRPDALDEIVARLV